MSKYLDLFEQNVQQNFLVGLFNWLKVVFYDQELGLRWRGYVILYSIYLRDEMSLTDVLIQTEELALCHIIIIFDTTTNKLDGRPR